MKNSLLRSALPFLAGFAIAAAAGVGYFAGTSEAEADGGWNCYVTDRFPDMDKAAEWKGSIKMAEGLDQVAAHVPSGTMMVLELPVVKGWGGYGGNSQGAPSVLCVKP
ncbi:MAG: hypothetical protein KDA24_25900 [Deltaproteobacteria bacterium]|nr:hypothetical protein [Deltaproteobacteria bacterium]